MLQQLERPNPMAVDASSDAQLLPIEEVSRDVRDDGGAARSPTPPALRRRCEESGRRRLQRLSFRYTRLGNLAARAAASIRRWRLIRARGLSLSLKRALDLLIATSLLALMSPILGPAIFVLYASGGRLRREPRVGRHLREFTIYRFPASGRYSGLVRLLWLDRLTVLLNVVKGDMSIVGPRALRPDELSLGENSGRRRHTDRPGCLCLWWIRSRANIDYGSEADSDAEYVDQFSFRSDLGIMARAAMAALYGEQTATEDSRVRILGIPVDNVSMQGAVDQIMDLIDSRTTPQRVCFVNADCANIACRNDAYRASLETSDVVYADGIGMKLAGRLLQTGVRQNVNGTDLFPRLCERMSYEHKRLFLLGAKPGVAERVAQWVREKHPGVEVCGQHHGYFSNDELPQVLSQIREAQPDVLLVAFGAPHQDLWIETHIAATGAKVAIGVGGLFDFFSGNVSRAPQWMREVGMEWFWRFLQEPRRMWRRYFVGNGVFMFRVFCERIRLFRFGGVQRPGS